MDFLAAVKDFSFLLWVLIFYTSFIEISHFFDGRICAIETMFNHLVFHVVGMELYMMSMISSAGRIVVSYPSVSGGNSSKWAFSS